MQNIVITGASGFVGTNLTKMFIDEGCNVIAVNRKDLQNIEEEIGANYNEFKEHYNEATKEKYNFLYVDNRNIELWKNFEELLWAK